MRFVHEIQQFAIYIKSSDIGCQSLVKFVDGKIQAQDIEMIVEVASDHVYFHVYVQKSIDILIESRIGFL